MSKKLYQNTFIFTFMLIISFALFILFCVKVIFFKVIPPTPDHKFVLGVLAVYVILGLLVLIFAIYGMSLSRDVFLDPVHQSQCTILYTAKAFLKTPTDPHSIKSGLFS